MIAKKDLWAIHTVRENARKVKTKFRKIAMQQLSNKQKAFKNELIKKLHTIKSTKGLTDDQYNSALLSFGVSSSTEMSIDQLLHFITLLNGIDPDADMWRKRCMAAIGGWLRTINRTESADFIKGIACKATGYKSFNSIPTSRLRDIYSEFSRKGKTAQTIESIVESELLKQIISN